MYENYTRQSLPSRKYRELLGSAVCVFNSNNSFVIENILRLDSNQYSWTRLLDNNTGYLKRAVEETITKNAGNSIAELFEDIIKRRNRIVHSFQITDSDDEQRLATRDRETGEQYVITQKYLLDFIHDNERLSDMLYSLRGF